MNFPKLRFRPLGSSVAALTTTISGAELPVRQVDDEVVIHAAPGRAGMPPDLVRLGNGDLLAAFREGGDHMDEAGRIVFKRSSDEGRTWGPLQIIRPAEDPPIDFRDPAIVELADGTLLCTFFHYKGALHTASGISKKDLKNPNAHRSGNTIHVMHSLDGGPSWNNETVLDLPSLGVDWALTTEKCIQLAAGRVLMPVFCGSLDGRTQIAGILASDDHGASWFHLSTAQTETWDPKRPYSLESSIVQAKNGTLILVSRTKTRGMLIAYSNDDGKSWQDQRLMPEMASSTQPNLCVLSDGLNPAEFLSHHPNGIILPCHLMLRCRPLPASRPGSREIMDTLAR